MRLAFRTAATDDRTGRRVRGEWRRTTASDLPPSRYELTVGRRASSPRRSAVAGDRATSSRSRIRRAAWSTDRRRPCASRACRRPETEYELWLPFTDAVELLALRADAPVAPPADRARRRAGCTTAARSATAIAPTRTTGTWPVVAALATDVELTNLAFSGSAMLDPFTARTMRDQPADLISLKVGINLVNGDVMRMRAFRPAVRRVPRHDPRGASRRRRSSWSRRSAASRSSWPPVRPSRIRREPYRVVDRRRHRERGRRRASSRSRAIRADARARSSRARRVDGPEPPLRRRARASTAPADAERMPLPDNLHPGPDVQRLIGERFAELVLTPFAGRRG